jgi:hypothetical protein
MTLPPALALLGAALCAFQATGQECPAWDKQVSELTPRQRDALRDEGAVYTTRAFIISRSLVPACSARISLGNYICQVLNAGAPESSRDAARKYSKDLRSVILRIWPSVSGSNVLPSDGALRHEAYGVLQGLTRADLTDVLRKLIVSEGINTAIAYLILETRPTGIAGSLTSYGDSAGITTQAIYATGLLAALDPRQGIPKLKAIPKTRRLDASQRKVLDALIAKADSGGRIVSDDFIDLEYEP